MCVITIKTLMEWIVCWFSTDVKLVCVWCVGVCVWGVGGVGVCLCLGYVAVSVCILMEGVPTQEFHTRIRIQ